MKQVSFKLYGGLSAYVANYDLLAGVLVRAEDGCDLLEIMSQLGIPTDVKSLFIFSARNQRVDGGYVPQDGEEIVVHTPVAGG